TANGRYCFHSASPQTVEKSASMCETPATSLHAKKPRTWREAMIRLELNDNRPCVAAGQETDRNRLTQLQCGSNNRRTLALMPGKSRNSVNSTILANFRRTRARSAGKCRNNPANQRVAAASRLVQTLDHKRENRRTSDKQESAHEWGDWTH